MTREETLDFVLEICKEVHESGKTYKQVCKERGITFEAFRMARKQVRQWVKKGKVDRWLTTKEKELLYGTKNKV